LAGSADPVGHTNTEVVDEIATVGADVDGKMKKVSVNLSWENLRLI